MRFTALLPALIAASLLFAASCTQPSAAEKAAGASKPVTNASAGNADTASDSATAAVADSASADSAPATASGAATADITNPAPAGADDTAAAPSAAATSPSGISASLPARTEDPDLIFGIPVDSYNIETGRVRRNQFISTILAVRGIPWNTIEELLRTNRETFDPRRVRTGSTWSAFITKDTLSRTDYFIYNHDPRVTYVFSLKDRKSVV